MNEAMVNTTIDHTVIESEKLDLIESIQETNIGSKDVRTFIVVPRGNASLFALVAVATDSLEATIILTRQGSIPVTTTREAGFTDGPDALAHALVLVNRCYKKAMDMVSDKGGTPKPTITDTPQRIH